MSGPEKRILIVDDEPDLRELIVFDFEAAGFKVFEAESARTALASLEKNQVDVVVSDIRMSDGDGITLLTEIKKRYTENRPAVVFITGYSDVSKEEALQHGASGFFFKPFDRRELIAAVETLLNKKHSKTA